MQERKESGKRGRKPGRKASTEKIDMKAKLGKEYAIHDDHVDGSFVFPKIFNFNLHTFQREVVKVPESVVHVRSYVINTWKN